MKKIVTGLFAMALVAGFAAQAFAAAPLFTEDFSYAVNTAMNGTGGWAAHSGAGTNPIKVTVPGGLTYPGYPGSGIGNLCGTLATSGEDINHTFTAVTSGSVYAALMVNVTGASNPGGYFFHFFDGAITGNFFFCRLFVQKDPSSSNYAYGVQYGSTVTNIYTPYSYAYGTTHLIVLKYTYVPGALNDVVSLYVDPAVTCSEPTTPNLTVTTTETTADASSLDGVAIRQGSAASSPTVQLDGIRVANNWPDAVCGGLPVPTHGSTWGQLKSNYR